jgi:hypothetical protein
MLIKGLSSQVWVMNENKRYSILFQVDVPGGK